MNTDSLTILVTENHLSPTVHCQQKENDVTCPADLRHCLCCPLVATRAPASLAALVIVSRQSTHKSNKLPFLIKPLLGPHPGF